jgi:DNA-binding LacI/PurR family transcriptional regulator
MKLPAGPNLRTLAKEAGYSPMTVSLALRNHPKISEATRRKIQQLARRRGYRPDPEISKLMHHLRVRRPQRLQAVVAALTTMDRRQMNRYAGTIERAARQRAMELGFGYDPIEIGPHPESRAAVGRILRSRGIEGLLLLPMQKPVGLEAMLDWAGYSVVATSHSVIAPRFHAVLPDGFNSTLVMCAKLWESGCRRMGLVLSSEMEERSRHNLSAAVLWHNRYVGGVEVRPLIIQPGEAGAFRKWLQRERPDAVISETPDREGFLKWMGCGAGRGLRRFRFAGISLGRGDGGPGMLQREEEIGRTAVELLAGMIQRGEKGVPEHPKLTLIPGLWKDPVAD